MLPGWGYLCHQNLFKSTLDGYTMVELPEDETHLSEYFAGIKHQTVVFKGTFYSRCR